MFYGNDMVRFWLRKLESLRNMTLTIRKKHLIWIFYGHVRRKNIIPRFLRFKLSNRQLQFSDTYNIERLLNQEISNKRKLVRTTEQNLTSMKGILHHEMCFTDFAQVTTILLVSHDQAISKIQKASQFVS